MKSNDLRFRLLGINGLILLLGLILWAQKQTRPSTNPAHDHADPVAHGQSVEGTPLDPSQSGIPSGILQDGVRVVKTEAFQYGFSPDPIVVQAGESVQLLLTSRDVTHGIMIPEVDVSTSIPVGEQTSLPFTAPEAPGEYPIFCSVFCGADHGSMKGTLVVIQAETAPKGHHE